MGCIFWHMYCVNFVIINVLIFQFCITCFSLYLFFSFLFYVTDVFKAGIWAQLGTLIDPKLKSLASELPSLTLQSRQEGTVRNYNYGWERWKLWASDYPEIVILPAESRYVALYLLDLYKTSRTSAPVTMAFYSIAWAHKLAGLPDPTLGVLPRMVKDAAPRTLTGYSNKKEPVTVDMLKKLALKYGALDANLMDLRIASMCLLAFAGFLRFKELVNLRLCDVQFFKGYVRLFVESSKTDIYRDGAWGYVARTNSETCPVSMLSRYLLKAGFSTYSEMFIFRGITRHRDVTKHRLKNTNTPLSYTTARSLVLNVFQSLGLDPSLFGTHSLRAGGATTAANNSIPDRLFKKHGRWLSDRSKDRYVKESIAQKLLVSQNLGL